MNYFVKGQLSQFPADRTEGICLPLDIKVQDYLSLMILKS